MPTKPPIHRSNGVTPKATAKAHDRWRGSAASRGYDRHWRRVREQHLDEHPLCLFCQQEGVVKAAEEVDHIKTIEERPDLRLDPTNLRSLCKPHHSERTGRDRAI